MYRVPRFVRSLSLVLCLAGVCLQGGCRGPQPGSQDGTPIESEERSLGEPFTAVDIGTVGATGSWTLASGLHTVKGAGADIWTAADAFRFVYLTLPGNGTITARVASLGNTNGFAKAGVMIRETLAAGSKNTMVLMTPTAANGFRFQARVATGGTTDKVFTGSGVAPNWVRLTRTGNTFTGFYSSNGTTWNQILPAWSVTMATNTFVGLAVTSHVAGTLTTATFDNVSITTPAPAAPPGAPTNVMATAGNGQVSLSWSSVSGAASYTVKRSTTKNGPYTNLPSVTATSLIDTGRTNGTTYYYVVSASNASGQGPDSIEVSATPTLPPPPPAPGGVLATPGNAQVTVSWNSVSGATSYTVKRSDVAEGPFSPLAAGLTGTSFNHSDLSNGTTIYYVVSATGPGGEGPDSVVVQATPTAPPPPPAPGGVLATAGNAQVTVSWNSVSGATSYTVKSGSSSMGPFTVVQSGLTSTSFNHTGLSNGTTYYYVVFASNAGGPGPDSVVVQATPTAPPPPSFTSQDVGNIGTAPGSWSDSSGTHTVKGAGNDIYGSADAFRFAYQTITGDVTITARVQSLTAQNPWTKAVVMIREDLTAGSMNVATVLSPTTTNKYRLQVRNAAGGSTTSTASADASAIPSYLRLERVGSTFRSFYSLDSGATWKQIGSAVTVTMNAAVRVGIGVTSHTANVLATGVFTNVSIVVPPPPAAPTALAAGGQNKQVHLTWAPSTGASSYTVKRAASPGGSYAVVASNIMASDVDPPQYTDTGLMNGTSYYYVVSASNSTGPSPNSAEVSAVPQLLRPSVRTVNPQDLAVNVVPNQFVSTDLIMPNVGGGVDVATLTSANVYLLEGDPANNLKVPATLNTSGGGDVVVLQPVGLLAHTDYTFVITSGLQDLTGAPFQPFTSRFTTGDPLPPPDQTVAFDKVALSNIPTGKSWTSITIGPDNKLYAASVTGDLYRWSMNTNGTLGTATLINSIRTGNGGSNRAIVGLAFDPAATATNLILWVTHGGSALKEAPDWSGKLSKLTGASLQSYQDVVINFPRSYKDHMTNSIAFKPGLPTVVWIVQGSMNAMGAPDNAWGQRAEHLLAAAILRLDTTKLTTLPLDVKTNDSDPTASMYNPFAANAPLTIWASGVRNAYDLMWHSNGELYTAVNGSAAGGNSPATTSPLPSSCTRRMDKSTAGNYTGPSVPAADPEEPTLAINGNPVAEDDYLFRIVQNGYYGHPNPARCEWVLNGGNPTSGTDKLQVTAYPVGTQPDRNWKKDDIFSFGQHFSPDGMIEWTSTARFPSLKGKILVVRYSGGDDVVAMTLDATTKRVVGSAQTITGANGFVDPLDLVANPATGHIYVTEHAGKKITLLRPRP